MQLVVTSYSSGVDTDNWLHTTSLCFYDLNDPRHSGEEKEPIIHAANPVGIVEICHIDNGHWDDHIQWYSCAWWFPQPRSPSTRIIGMTPFQFLRCRACPKRPRRALPAAILTRYISDAIEGGGDENSDHPHRNFTCSDWSLGPGSMDTNQWTLRWGHHVPDRQRHGSLCRYKKCWNFSLHRWRGILD